MHSDQHTDNEQNLIAQEYHHEEEEELSEEQIQQMVRELLPEVTNTIRAQVQAELQAEFEKRLKQQSEGIMQQAKAELEELIATIKQQSTKVLHSSLIELDRQILNVEQRCRQLQQTSRQVRFRHFKQTLMSDENLFEEEILGHPVMKRVEQAIYEETESRLNAKYNTEYARKEKQLILKLKNKHDREIRDLQSRVESEINEQVAEEQRLLEKERIELARLKSDYNLKIRKLQTETKEYKAKMEERTSGYQKVVDDLRLKLDKLKSQQFAKKPDAGRTLKDFIEDIGEDTMESTFHPKQQKNNMSIPDKLIPDSSSDSQNDHNSEQDEEDIMEMPLQPPESITQRPSEYQQEYQEQSSDEDDWEYKQMIQQKERLLDINPKMFLSIGLENTEPNTLEYNRGQAIPVRNNNKLYSEASEQLSKYIPTDFSTSMIHRAKHQTQNNNHKNNLSSQTHNKSVQKMGSSTNFREQYQKQLSRMNNFNNKSTMKLSTQARNVIMSNILKNASEVHRTRLIDILRT